MQSTKSSDTPTVSASSIKSPLDSHCVPLRISQMDNMRNENEAFKKATAPHSGWEVIRQLDDQENWAERTTVISKQDHQLYSDCATEIIHDLVDNIPPGRDSPDEGNLEESGEQLVGTGGSSPLPPPFPYSEEQLVQAPPTDSTGEYDYMREFGDEEFQTSSSQFDMDYLERVSSNTNPTAMSSLARESLFVKFDPLVGRKTPDDVYRQPHPSHNIPSGDNLLMLDTPPQNLQQPPSHDTSITYHSNTPSHPTTPQNLLDISGDSTQMATPYYSNSSRNTTLLNTTPRTVRGSSPHAKSLFNTSLSASVLSTSTREANTPMSGGHYMEDEPTEDDSVKVFKYTEEDMEEIKQQYEVMLVNARHEHAVESAKQQKKMDRLVKELQNLRAHNAIVLTDKTLAKESNQDLEELCTQYQQTETEILNAYQQLKEDVKVVEQERNQAFKDFASLEKSFTEFHQRYTKSKGLVTELQETVSALQEYIEKLEAQLDRTKQINTELQSEVNLQLQEANETYDKIKREHTSEAAVLKASLRKLTLQVDGQQKQLEQKEQEKAELTLLCEELMKELGNR